MSLSMSDKCEKANLLNVPEILADFFLKKLDMPSHSDDSDLRSSKNKRKKSKHKKHKHKKSKHRHRHSSSDSSSRESDFNSKSVVEDVSSSEEMGIKRLKKIKKMKLQSVDKTILQTVTACDDGQNKEKSNSSTSENLVFYGPSLELLLSGVESNSAVKVDSVTNVEDSKDHKNSDLNSDVSKNENSLTNNTDLSIGVDSRNIQCSGSAVPLPVKNSEVEQKRVHDNSVPISDVKHSVSDKYDADNCSISPEKSSSDKIESVQKNINYEEVTKNSDKNDNDAKQNDSHGKTKLKCKDRKKKHSRSRSRSVSQSRHHSPKSRQRRTSRSSSRESRHSHKRRKRHSHSRSHSREKFKSHKNMRRSHSRSRSRSRQRRHVRNIRSRSPYTRHRHRRSRSRSRSLSRGRRRSNSRTRKNSHSRHRKRSSSRSRHKSKSDRWKTSHSRSRSKSRSRQRKHSKEKSRSSSKSREKNSQSSTKIDQAKILETARKNILKMMQNGTLPEGLPVENLKKDQLVSIQAGGKSVQELTDFCQRLSQKENEVEEIDNEDKDEKPDDETGFINHPFKVKEPGIIKLNIKNAVQLPIKTHAQKVAETVRLTSQFPVSSGNQHKQKELEWIPVVPASTKNETKSVATTVSTVAPIKKPAAVEPKPVVKPIPPPVSSIPMPISYPTISSEGPVMDVQTITPPLVPPPIPPPLPPPLPLVQPPMPPPTVFQIPVQPIMPSFTMPNQEMIHSYVPPPTTVQSSTLVFKTPKKLDIPAIIARRFQALTKLQENPDDPEALKVINDAQESIQEWVESQQVPGLFTGSTDAKVLTAAELCGPKFYKFRKKIKVIILLAL